MIREIVAALSCFFISKARTIKETNLFKGFTGIFNSKITIAKKEMVLYIVFGVLTTLVNILSYLLFVKVFGINNLLSNVMAWVFSIVFAYITNRIYVFESKNENILYEFSLFVLGRGLSGIVDSLLFYTFVVWWMLDDVLSKIVINIIVIILNYVFSKWIIFKEK